MMPATRRTSFLALLLLLMPCGVRTAPAQSPAEEALKAVEQGDYDKAERLLAQNPDLLPLKGILQYYRGDYAAARAALEKSAETADARHIRIFLALARAATGACDEALGPLAVEFESNEPSPVHRLAGLALVQCHLGDDRLDEVFPVLHRLSAFYSDDPDVLYQSAKFHMKAWNEVISQMFDKAPASFRVNQLSAEVLETQGRYSDAITEYSKAIEKNPSALHLHFRLGRALLMDSHSPEALEKARVAFQAELALNPHDAVAEYQIGQILTVQQKPEEAAGRFERALLLKSDFPEALLALGKLRMEAQEHDAAIELFEQSVQLQPQSEAARYSLMIAYRNAGRMEDAQRQQEEIEKLQQAPEGEFMEFLKKLGETPAKP